MVPGRLEYSHKKVLMVDSEDDCFLSLDEAVSGAIHDNTDDHSEGKNAF